MVQEKGSRERCSSWTACIKHLCVLSSGFPLSQGNAEALDRWGGKTRHRLISYLLSNTSAKNYYNWIVCVKIIASQRWDVFWDTVYKGLDSWNYTIHFSFISSFLWWPLYVRRSIDSWQIDMPNNLPIQNIASQYIIRPSTSPQWTRAFIFITDFWLWDCYRQTSQDNADALFKQVRSHYTSVRPFILVAYLVVPSRLLACVHVGKPLHL